MNRRALLGAGVAAMAAASGAGGSAPGQELRALPLPEELDPHDRGALINRVVHARGYGRGAGLMHSMDIVRIPRSWSQPFRAAVEAEIDAERDRRGRDAVSAAVDDLIAGRLDALLRREVAKVMENRRLVEVIRAAGGEDPLDF